MQELVYPGDRVRVSDHYWDCEGDKRVDLDEPVEAVVVNDTRCPYHGPGCIYLTIAGRKCFAQSVWLELIERATPAQPLAQQEADKIATPCSAIMAALERIEANKGKDGFRKPFDLAMKIKLEIEWAGYKIVVDPKGPWGKKAVETRLAAQRRQQQAS